MKSPKKKGVFTDFSLKLKFPGMNANEKGMMLNVFEEALNEHM